jgi:hypothetical protein
MAMLSSCGMANPSTDTGPTNARVTGCPLPVSAYEPTATFIGIRAIARTGVRSDELLIGFKAQRSRWCVLSFVQDERTHPIIERVYFLSGASAGDVSAVIAYMKRLGLFVQIEVLRPRIYPYANQYGAK